MDFFIKMFMDYVHETGFFEFTGLQNFSRFILFLWIAKCRATDFLRKHFWQSVRDFLRKDFGQVYGITLKCHSKNNVAILTFENMNIWRIIGSPKNFVIK